MEIFAGINGESGYVPMLEYNLSGVKRVYIIKGSPGSGKSTLMKRIASKAISLGEDVIKIRCSSDPDSLDGLILPRLSVGVADGTPPHAMEPKKYGIREQTVSLEASFDYDRLDFFSGRLTRLFEKKSAYTKAASSAVAAFGQLENARREYVKPALQQEKIETFCKKFIRKNTQSSGGSIKIYPIDTFCRKGFVTTSAFDGAENIYIVRDKFGISENVLQSVFYFAKEAKTDMFIIPCPVDARSIGGIYFPKTKTLIKSDRFIPMPTGKSIRCVSFSDPEGIASHRARLNAISKLGEKLFEEAIEAFTKAFETHLEIEKIYSQCVDFDITDKVTKNLSERIFKE